MAENVNLSQEPEEPISMSIVLDRELKICWADQVAVKIFGPNILNALCHSVLMDRSEPCDPCAVRKCFTDGKEHIQEAEVVLGKLGKRNIRRTAKPAEFSPDGTLLLVKEIIEDITRQSSHEDMIRRVEQTIGGKQGQQFFNAMATELADKLDADVVYIGEFKEHQTRVKTIAVCEQGLLVPNFEYPLQNNPCRKLLDKQRWVCPSQVRLRFPQSELLKEKSAEGYAGVQLYDSRRKPIGIMVALYRRDLKDPEGVQSNLLPAAERVGAELVRFQHHRTVEDYRHIMSRAHDLLALVDINFCYQAVNRAYASFYGLPAEHIIGQQMEAIVGSGFFNQTILPAARECFQGRESHVQIWQKPENRPKRYFQIAFYPHYEKGANRIKGFVLTARDITRTKKLENNLRQVHKMETIGKLTGGIVHDFNNILGAIIGYTELALSLLKDQPEVTKCLLEVQTAGTRATDLVKQILAFSRQNDRTRKPVQPKIAVKEALRLLRATIPVMITIETTIESDAYVMADPIQLHQIVINLCANANHAMRHKGGVLRVQLHDLELDEIENKQYPGLEPGHYVKLTVTDTGIGIPQEIQNKIFTPFFTTKKKGEGTGLGLSTVASIVKSYQGKIFIKSQPGQGSTFTILLPAIESRSETGGDQQTDLYYGNERILIIEDEEALVQVTAKLLSGLGYSIKTATDSTRALELFQTDPYAFDLVLSDMAMPGIAGDILAQRMLALRPGIPIIVMTGYSDRLSREKARLIGIKNLIYKPLSPPALSKAIRKALENRDDDPDEEDQEYR